MRIAAGWMLMAVLAVARAEEVLETAGELRRLIPEEAAEKRPVRIEGVVTSIRGVEFPEFTMQDGTGGLVAHLEEPVGRRVRPGQRVVIEGVSNTQPPTPRVRVRKLEVGEMEGMPEPRRVSGAGGEGGEHDCVYVEFSGVIRRAAVEESIQPRRLVLDFGPAERRLAVWVSNFDEALPETLRPDTAVTVRGIYNTWRSPSFQPFSTFIVVTEPSEIGIDRGPLEEPERPLRELLAMAVDEYGAHRERARGIVTLSWPDGQVVLENEQGAIRVWAEDVAAGLRLGEEVEVAGFPTRRVGGLELENAVFGVPRAAGLVMPQEVGAPEVLRRSDRQDREGRLLRVGGVFRGISRQERGVVLAVESEGRMFQAVLPRGESPPGGLEEGAGVVLTGVCHMLFEDRARRFGRYADGFELHLQDARAIAIAGSRPWWTMGRLMVAGFPVLAGSLVWALVLRRRVGKRSALLVREIRARHDAELLAAERMRLAGDLHDTLSQSLSGAAMQLEVARALAGSAEEAEGHFSLARRLLNRSREDLRRAVWDLGPSALADQDLAAALEGVAREISEGCEVSVTAAGKVEELPERVRVHLFRVGQEALNNALCHAKPGRVEVRVAVENGEAVLEVADDGCGFDPESAPGPEEGHFGLRSLRERLGRLGGTLAILSSSQGTRVMARVPLVSVSPEIS